MSSNGHPSAEPVLVQLGVRIPEDLHRRLKLASVRRNTLIRDLVATALERELRDDRQAGGS